jgi:hypothetical protein
MKFNFLKTSFAMAALILSYCANAGLITNGSLTGSTANNNVPAGWSKLTGSPDTNDILYAAGYLDLYMVSASLSPDGGTWVGVAKNDYLHESFGQIVSGLTVGSMYELTWFNAHFGADSGAYGYNGNNSFSALLDGTSIGTGSLLSLGDNWAQESLIFTATSNSHQIGFGLSTSTAAYLQIDGISLREISAAVPEPSTLAIFALGMIGLASRRFKKQS